jgi:hypothetical protein
MRVHIVGAVDYFPPSCDGFPFREESTMGGVITSQSSELPLDMFEPGVILRVKNYKQLEEINDEYINPG